MQAKRPAQLQGSLKVFQGRRRYHGPATGCNPAVAYDEELETFSEGHEYRQNILLAWLYERQHDRWPMTYKQQVLIGYIVFGNPVNAFQSLNRLVQPTLEIGRWTSEVPVQLPNGVARGSVSS